MIYILQPKKYPNIFLSEIGTVKANELNVIVSDQRYIEASYKPFDLICKPNNGGSFFLIEQEVKLQCKDITDIEFVNTPAVELKLTGNFSGLEKLNTRSCPLDQYQIASLEPRLEKRTWQKREVVNSDLKQFKAIFNKYKLPNNMESVIEIVQTEKYGDIA